MFGQPDEQELAAILADDDNCERDALLELLLYPDLALRARLEPLLEDNPAQASCAEVLADRLRARLGPLRVVSPDGVALALPSVVLHGPLDRFVARLRLGAVLPPTLRLTVEKAFAQDLANRVKAELRSLRNLSGAARIAFLERFLAAAPPSDPGFGPTRRLALEFIDSVEEQPDLYEAFMDRKRLARLQLLQALDLARRLRRDNIETLLLQGVRPAAKTADEARAELLLIDRVSLWVFGRTEDLGPEPREADLGDFGPEDAHHIIELLS